jgi:hypothetical protein
MAHVVPVLEPALEHDRERLHAAMGVRGEARAELLAISGADLVEHQERIEVVRAPAHEAENFHARAIRGGLALQYLAYASVHGDCVLFVELEAKLPST